MEGPLLKTYLLVVAVLLVGCVAHTPQTLTQEGSRTDHALSQSPRPAAACMARNIEAHAKYVVASVRDGEKEGTIEVLVRGAGAGQTAVYALLEPTNPSSRVTVWMSPYPFYGREEFVPAMVKGC